MEDEGISFKEHKTAVENRKSAKQYLPRCKELLRLLHKSTSDMAKAQKGWAELKPVLARFHKWHLIFKVWNTPRLRPRWSKWRPMVVIIASKIEDSLFGVDALVDIPTSLLFQPFCFFASLSATRATIPKPPVHNVKTSNPLKDFSLQETCFSDWLMNKITMLPNLF